MSKQTTSEINTIKTLCTEATSSQSLSTDKLQALKPQIRKKKYIAPKLTFEGDWDTITASFGGIISNAP